jgi:hypothetical protein
LIIEIFWNEQIEDWETKEMKNETQASLELRIFFERLLELKAEIKLYADRTNMAAFQEIYRKLDSIIKEAQ